MAAGPFKWTTNALYLLMKGDLDLDAGLRAVLVTKDYTPNQATHDEWDDASANEVADGGGYLEHGKPLTSISISKSGLESRLDADNPVWASSTITAKYLVVVKDANDDNALAATDKIIGYVDLNTDATDADVSSTAADFTGDIAVTGLMKLTAD